MWETICGCSEPWHLLPSSQTRGPCSNFLSISFQRDGLLLSNPWLIHCLFFRMNDLGFKVFCCWFPLIRVCCSDSFNYSLLLKSFPSLLSMAALVQFRFPFNCFKAGLSTVENIGYCFLVPRLIVLFRFDFNCINIQRNELLLLYPRLMVVWVNDLV